MSDPISILKNNPLLPAEDYVSLRKKGIKHIEKLGSSIWTDYNTSDPGISVLEAVCYAITDLAYRTDFEIKDLLAPENLTEKTWNQIFYTARQILHNNPLTIHDYRKLIIDIKGVRNAWIEPSKDYEVPVWVNYNHVELKEDLSCGCKDSSGKICYGRLSIESDLDAGMEKNETLISNITNILNEKASHIQRIKERINKTAEKPKNNSNEGERKKLLNQLKQLLKEKTVHTNEVAKLKKQQSLIAKDSPTLQLKIVEFEGLYEVMVEYEEDVLDEEQREMVREQVVAQLTRRRNLCQDFLSINAVEYVDVGIKASIVLAEDADPDTVLAQIFFVIYKYFTPSIPFYTIPQMQAKGYSVDETFEGPALNHGFIDTKDLEKTDLFRNIRLSDIISDIVNLKGVKAITYLRLPADAAEGDTPATEYFNQWIRYLQEERKVGRIQPDQSQVVFCKERAFITYNTGSTKDRRPDRMLKLFRELKILERKYKLEGVEADFPVPVGEYMELEDYFPVTYSLPICYGVNDRAGLPAGASEKRKVQALQLKGYLLFFEQILASYLMQLNHLKDLFSFDESITQTYFSKALTEMGDLQALLVNHGNHDDFNQVLQDFTRVLQNLTEPTQLFHERRNRFLNHMLARFSEDMREYEAVNRLVAPKKVDERLIKDKLRLLQNGEYYKISTNRGRGYNYAQPNFWDTLNISGAERRISRLLGFKSAKRRTLAPDFLIFVPIETETKKGAPAFKDGKPRNIIKLVDPDNHDTTLLTSVEVKTGCCTEELLNEILKYAGEKRFFKFHDEINQRSRKSAGLIGTFWFELWDSTEEETAVTLAISEKFDSKSSRNKAFIRLQQVMNIIDSNEGLHLVEHLLLRPKLDEVYDETGNPLSITLLDICLDVCDLGKGLGEGEEPLYRKRIHRIPAEKCYDKMPWVLGYYKYKKTADLNERSLLFQETFTDGRDPLLLKFRKYEGLNQRVKELQEYGSEETNYQIISNINPEEEIPANIRYSFIIKGSKGKVLAQSEFKYETRDQAKKEIQSLISYFGHELDWYCEENPCDHNEDPYSFRATVVLPCWPKRLRDQTFRNLVEKTIQTEFPAHVHARVVWVGIQEMQRFEIAYYDWLQEMARNEIPAYEKVNPLVEVLNTLKPCGSCKDECQSGQDNPNKYATIQ